MNLDDFGKTGGAQDSNLRNRDNAPRSRRRLRTKPTLRYMCTMPKNLIVSLELYVKPEKGSGTPKCGSRINDLMPKCSTPETIRGITFAGKNYIMFQKIKRCYHPRDKIQFPDDCRRVRSATTSLGKVAEIFSEKLPCVNR